jgi:hypothetical protein
MNNITDEQIARLKLAIYRISKGDFDPTDDETRRIAIAASEARAAPSRIPIDPVGRFAIHATTKPAARGQEGADLSGWTVNGVRIQGSEASATGAEPTEYEKTFPDHIWLDAGEAMEFAEAGDTFRDLEEVTWSEDNATGFGVKYVRADLAATPTSAPMQAQKPIAWMRAGANPWHGYEACPEGDGNGFPVYAARTQANPTDGAASS